MGPWLSPEAGRIWIEHGPAGTLIGPGVAAGVFGHQAALAWHAVAAMPLLPAAVGAYPTAVANLLRGLARAGQAPDSRGDERSGLLSELDEMTGWLAALGGELRIDSPPGRRAAARASPPRCRWPRPILARRPNCRAGRRARAGARPRPDRGPAWRRRSARNLPELGQHHRSLRSCVVLHQRHSTELERPDRRVGPADAGGSWGLYAQLDAPSGRRPSRCRSRSVPVAVRRSGRSGTGSQRWRRRK